jgi:xylulokinase
MSACILAHDPADILERPIQRLNLLDEATAVGAAIAGGLAVGFTQVVEETQPDPAHFETYRRLYRIFRDSYTSLRGVFARLAQT